MLTRPLVAFGKKRADYSQPESLLIFHYTEAGNRAGEAIHTALQHKSGLEVGTFTDLNIMHEAIIRLGQPDKDRLLIIATRNDVTQELLDMGYLRETIDGQRAPGKKPAGLKIVHGTLVAEEEGYIAPENMSGVLQITELLTWRQDNKTVQQIMFDLYYECFVHDNSPQEGSLPSTSRL